MVYSSKPQCLKTESENKCGQSNHQQYCLSRFPVGCGSERVLVGSGAGQSRCGLERAQVERARVGAAHSVVVGPRVGRGGWSGCGCGSERGCGGRSECGSVCECGPYMV